MPPFRNNRNNRNKGRNGGNRNHGRSSNNSNNNGGHGRPYNNSNRNPIRSSIEYPTPISVRADFIQKELPKITIQSAQGKKEVYVMKPQSKESFLYALQTYESAAGGLEFTVKQRIAGLRDILDASLHNHYIRSLGALNINLAGAGNIPAARYDQMVAALKRAIFTDYDRAALCEYLSRGQPIIPHNMDPRTFHLRLQTLQMYADLIPGNAPVPDDDVLHSTFFYAQPDSARREFHRMYTLPSNVDTEDLIAFMERQARYNSPGSRGSGNGNGDDGNAVGFNRHSNNRQHSNNDNHGSNRNSRQPCPLHPQHPHSWLDCFANPLGPNYNAEYAARLHARSTSQRSGNQTSGSRNTNPRGPGNYANNSNRSAISNANANVTQTDGSPDSAPAVNAHMNFNRGNDPPGESVLALDPLPCHAVVAGPDTVDDGPLEGDFLARSAVHHFDLIGPSLQEAGDSVADDDDDESVTIEAFVEAYHNDDSPSASTSPSSLRELGPGPSSPLSVSASSLPPCPSTVAIARSIQNQSSFKPLISLLDSGSTYSHISVRALPSGATPTLLERPLRGSTLAGTIECFAYVQLSNISLPELDNSRRVESLRAFVFREPCNYDLILGNDFCSTSGLVIDFESQLVRWFDDSIPFKPPTPSTSDAAAIAMTALLLDTDTNTYAVNILESKYEQVSPTVVAEQQTHLTASQRADLAALLAKFPELFSGKLGLYPHRRVHLEIDPDAKPVYARPYSVAHNHRDLFRQELDRLVAEGVLEPCGATEWASPTFITPKKDGRVRWVSDFRELNKVIRRRVYPLPRIQDILAKRTGYEFFTKLDISMQFYTFELDEESRDLCAIVTPFGKYRYCRLPMGVKVSPDIAQEIMEDVLQNIPDNDVFMDDCGVFSKDWQSHLASLETILTRLQDNGFTINPLKCEWAVQETDWLGHWLTPTGLKPWRKKIEPLLRLAPPKSVTQVRQFVGAVTFYRDFFRRRSHVLAPLTALIGTKRFEWTPECDRAFNEMKALLSEDALLRYPDPNLPFHIYTDASELQLGSVIHQNDAPVAYFSRKLSDAQTRYSTIEKEILSVYETLRAFRPILLGAELHVYTDHRNLTFKHLNSHRVLYWRLLIEEFAPTFHYIPGKDNTCADALSRLPSLPPLASEEEQGPGDAFSLFADPLLLNCFVNLPADEPEQLFPLDYGLLQQRQQQDQRVQALLNDPIRYELLPFADQVQLVCRKGEQLQDPFRIVIPDSLLQAIVRWYHERLGHAGTTRLFETISALFYHGERLKETVESTVRRCPICQEAKLPPRGVGELATREAILAPWEEVHVDCIGPWTIAFQGRELTIDALTCIDPVTNLVELLRVDNKTAAHVAMKFENNWLARYPRPLRCIHDNGPEFIGYAFKQMLYVNGIRDKPVSKLNPQSNAVCERMHRTVADHIRTLFRVQPPNNIDAANDIIDTALAATSYALRASVNRALRTSPSAIVFHRDMILNIPLYADLALIRNRRQVLIDEQLRRANLRRHSFDYQPGQQVYLRIKNPSKLGPRSSGPYPITQVHTNGTITIQRRLHVTERVNIRRVYPFRP